MSLHVPKSAKNSKVGLNRGIRPPDLIWTLQLAELFAQPSECISADTKRPEQIVSMTKFRDGRRPPLLLPVLAAAASLITVG